MFFQEHLVNGLRTLVECVANIDRGVPRGQYVADALTSRRRRGATTSFHLYSTGESSVVYLLSFHSVSLRLSTPLVVIVSASSIPYPSSFFDPQSNPLGCPFLPLDFLSLLLHRLPSAPVLPSSPLISSQLSRPLPCPGPSSGLPLPLPCSSPARDGISNSRSARLLSRAVRSIDRRAVRL